MISAYKPIWDHSASVKVKWQNCLLVLLMTIGSGNPAFELIGKEPTRIGLFAVALIFWLRNPAPFNVKEIAFFALFSLIMAAQILEFGEIVLVANLGYLLTLATAALAVKAISHFMTCFVNVMATLAGISFFFFLPTLAGLDLASLLQSARAPLEIPELVHIWVHNFHIPSERWRNSGMFWEPGAFGAYLSLALLHIALTEEKAINVRTFLLVAALLSTASTASYIAFFFVMVIKLLKISYHAANKNRGSARLNTIVAAAACGVVAYFTYSEVPFLKEKIEGQRESAEVVTRESALNRFGNFWFDMEFVTDRPILGWSATPETRFGWDPRFADVMSAQGNALSGFAVKFGVVGFFVMVSFLLRGLRSLSGSLPQAVMALAAVSCLLFSEQLLNFTVFSALMFMRKGRDRLPHRVALHSAKTAVSEAYAVRRKLS